MVGLTPQHLYLAYVWYLNEREEAGGGGEGDEESFCFKCKAGGGVTTPPAHAPPDVFMARSSFIGGGVMPRHLPPPTAERPTEWLVGP